MGGAGRYLGARRHDDRVLTTQLQAALAAHPPLAPLAVTGTAAFEPRELIGDDSSKLAGFTPCSTAAD
jgi:hypothetical protein